jgi:hypothetical protein
MQTQNLMLGWRTCEQRKFDLLFSEQNTKEKGTGNKENKAT